MPELGFTGLEVLGDAGASLGLLLKGGLGLRMLMHARAGVFSLGAWV